MFFEGYNRKFASQILRVRQNMIHTYYNEIREKILQYSLKEQSKELGEFELDESYLALLFAKNEDTEQTVKRPFFGC